MKMLNWLLAALMSWALCAHAAPGAVVEAVQAPAWMKRGERMQPLAPGMEVRNRDRLVTGPNARAMVMLADGSRVKLGENTLASFNAMGQRDDGVFTAALDVATGSVRLTTDAGKTEVRHLINLRVGSVTARLRDGDLWGSSNQGKDFICLFDGSAVATHPQGQAVDLTTPLAVYGVDKGQAPGPMGVVDKSQATFWAFQTELADTVGTVEQGGRWMISLAVLDDQTSALALYDRAVAAGFAPTIRPFRSLASKNPSYRYEVRIVQIQTEREALLLAERLRNELQLPDPRIFNPGPQ